MTEDTHSLLEDFSGPVFTFRARREGRADLVQVGFESEGKDPLVVAMRASVVVASGDPWPKSLFEILGNPRFARASEWIWMDTTCTAALRLTKLDTLGQDRDLPYIVAVKKFED